ncbi:MAG TPA: hypothetical protein VJN18_14865 [Polyangiaceae bacterium]|nr:hypothetical protein [Polyangiaceae bacterium]
MVREPQQAHGNQPTPARARGPGAGPPATAGALELFTAELVRQLSLGLEGVVAVALEQALDQNAAPALHDRASLARELRCGVDTVDKMRTQGLPELRVGDSPRFELAAVLGWLRERREA